MNPQVEGAPRQRGRVLWVLLGSHSGRETLQGMGRGAHPEASTSIAFPGEPSGILNM